MESWHLLTKHGRVLVCIARDPRVRLREIAEALDALAERHSSLADLVDLKFFCGFTFDEIATMRGVSERTIRRQWEIARTYLHRHIRGQTPD